MTNSQRTGPSLRHQRHPVFARLFLVAVGILAALLISEVTLRVAGFTYFNPYIVDEDVGHALRPNAEGWWKKEGLTYVRINSHGFRDREHSIAKPPGTLRIAVLGDSFAEALQVPMEKTFISVVESKLNECPSQRSSPVEVLNFGVSGFSTARELILLRKRVWPYSPDVVVLLFTTGNDIRDNSRTLNEYKQQPLPYFVYRDGKLSLDDSLLAARNQTLGFRLQRSFIGEAFNWIQGHSRVMGLIYTAREAYRSSKEVALPERPQPQEEPGLKNEVYRENSGAEWEAAWQTTEALIQKMREEVEARGAKFLLVTGSMGIQVNPDPVLRQNFMAREGVQNLFHPDDRISDVGQRNGFKVLTLVRVLEEYARRNKVALHGSGDLTGKGHWNELGHQLVGEHIAAELCKTIVEN